MSLFQRIDIYFLGVWAIGTTWLALWWAPNHTKHTSRPVTGLRSARRRLAARSVKAEVRSTTLRFRRELDDELDRMDDKKGEKRA